MTTLYDLVLRRQQETALARFWAEVATERNEEVPSPRTRIARREAWAVYFAAMRRWECASRGVVLAPNWKVAA